MITLHLAEMAIHKNVAQNTLNWFTHWKQKIKKYLLVKIKL